MHACQNTKAEYVDGTTLYSDCQIPLTDESTKRQADYVQLISAEAPLAERLLEFLSYSGLDVHMDFDREADLFTVSLPEPQYDEGIQLAKLVFANEIFNTVEEKKRHPKRVIGEPVKAHIHISEEYREAYSSAFSFLLIGSSLLAAMILVCNKIVWLPLPEYAIGFTAAVATSTGAVFFCVGAYSLQKARLLQAKILEEQQFNDSVYQWFLSTYTASQIDLTADAEMDQDVAMHPEKRFTIISNEIRCLKRMDIIQKYLKRQYLYLDDEYITYLSGKIYTKIFGEDFAQTLGTATK